jgi:hypothetical protein
MKNVGRTDRVVRLMLGALLAIVGVLGYAGVVGLAFLGVGQALAAVLLVLVGAILLVTGATEVCLVYRVLGVDTRGHGGPREDEARVEKSA